MRYLTAEVFLFTAHLPPLISHNITTQQHNSITTQQCHTHPRTRQSGERIGKSVAFRQILKREKERIACAGIELKGPHSKRLMTFSSMDWIQAAIDVFMCWSWVQNNHKWIIRCMIQILNYSGFQIWKMWYVQERFLQKQFVYSLYWTRWTIGLHLKFGNHQTSKRRSRKSRPRRQKCDQKGF